MKTVTFLLLLIACALVLILCAGVFDAQAAGDAAKMATEVHVEQISGATTAKYLVLGALVLLLIVALALTVFLGRKKPGQGH